MKEYTLGRTDMYIDVYYICIYVYILYMYILLCIIIQTMNANPQLHTISKIHI